MARLLGLVWLTAATICAAETPATPPGPQPAGLMAALPHAHWAYEAVAWLGEAGMLDSVPGWRGCRSLSAQTVADLTIAAGDSLDPSRQAAGLLPSATLSVTRSFEPRGWDGWRPWWARQQAAAASGEIWSAPEPAELEAARRLRLLACGFAEPIAARGGHPEAIAAAADAHAAEVLRCRCLCRYGSGRLSDCRQPPRSAPQRLAS